MSAARALAEELGRRHARVIVAPHGDVDGLCAGLLTARALERLGATPIIEFPGKGEHVHTPSMQARLQGLRGDALVVLDMGSRRGSIVPGLPTIVIDHHDARDVPDGAIFVSAAGCEPVAPTGLIAYELFGSIMDRGDVEDLGWLALLATVGDLGERHPFAARLEPIARQHKKTHVKEAIALLNAARRSARYRPEVAWRVLSAANGPVDIARGALPGLDELHACRAEVKAEIERVARVAPRVANDVAVIPFTSGAQIHPLIATRWAGRLAPKIVIAANDGYLPGRVNFAVRSASNVDLLAFLRSLPLGEVEGEFANGHPRATGGSIPFAEFARLLTTLGFAPSVCAQFADRSGV
jgi:single-stranded-DNA-specific exonuclease